jgi:hypothetical protein
MMHKVQRGLLRVIDVFPTQNEVSVRGRRPMAPRIRNFVTRWRWRPDCIIPEKIAPDTL